MALRSFDTFVKPREDLRTRSALGGFITLVATIAAGLLFLGEVYIYIVGSTKHSLHLSPSTGIPILPASNGGIQQNNQIPLKIRVTFPHVQCKDLDVAHDNAFMSTGEFGRQHNAKAMRLRSATIRELEMIEPDSRNRRVGCTIDGSLKVPLVGGTFQISISRRAWQQYAAMAMFNAGATQFPNVTHYIHSVTFGEHFPLAHNPLENVPHVFENKHGGVGLSLVNVRLVPTRYKTLLSEQKMFQSSVTHTFVKPETLAANGSPTLPGLSITYDFTPLAVRHEQYRESFLVFLSSLVSIVGGTFVTVSLITGCLVHSASAVAKKLD
mmetsp:Transcript_4710/g.6692  ORF Transcript_4710/g.6692 Transcript_4710/m.6692 type:complete len:325 (+) Transcript_4710:166-1140(+)